VGGPGRPAACQQQILGVRRTVPVAHDRGDAPRVGHRERVPAPPSRSRRTRTETLGVRHGGSAVDHRRLRSPVPNQPWKSGNPGLRPCPLLARPPRTPVIDPGGPGRLLLAAVGIVAPDVGERAPAKALSGERPQGPVRVPAHSGPVGVEQAEQGRDGPSRQWPCELRPVGPEPLEHPVHPGTALRRLPPPRRVLPQPSHYDADV